MRSLLLFLSIVLFFTVAAENDQEHSLPQIANHHSHSAPSTDSENRNAPSPNEEGENPQSYSQSHSTSASPSRPISSSPSTHSPSSSLPTPDDNALSGPAEDSKSDLSENMASISGETTSPSVSFSPSFQTPADSSQLIAHEDSVFIPIKEWKRRKLRDMELRIQQLQRARLESDIQPSPDCEFGARNYPFLLPSSSSRSQCNKLVLFFRAQTCPFFLQDQVLPNISPTSMFIFTNIPSLSDPVSPVLLDQQEGKSEPQTSTHIQQHSPPTRFESAVGPDKQSSFPSEHDAIDSEYTLNNVDSDEVTGWIDASSFLVLNSLQRVATFVRSIRGLPFFAMMPSSTSNFTDQAVHMTCEKLPDPIFTSNGSASCRNASVRASINVSSYQARSGRSPIVGNVRPDDNGTDERISNTKHDDHLNMYGEKPYNFASVDSGARVLLSSKGTVGAKNILDNNVDKYLLVPCDGDKRQEPRWVDIELSEEVILERFQAANFEYYSSSPAKIVILGSGVYPPPKWQLLGMFGFANVRTLQMFLIEKRVVTRYLKILFVGKQGREYYCPISTVRAYGKTLIADWKDALNQQMALRRKDPSRPQSARVEEPSTSTQNPVLPEKTAEYPDTNGSGTSTVPSSPHSHNDLNSSMPSFEQSRTIQNRSSHVALNTNQTENVTANQNRYATPDTSSSLNNDATYEPASALNEEDVMSEDDQLLLEAVHADSLDQSSEDDNVFRKVTRMLRLLELNQTLTNQYIDTQLAKFASAIHSLQENVNYASRERKKETSELERQVYALRTAIAEFEKQHHRNSVIVTALLLVSTAMVIAFPFAWVSTYFKGPLTARLVGSDIGVAKDNYRSGDQNRSVFWNGEEQGHDSRKRRKRRKRRDKKNGISIEEALEGATESTQLVEKTIPSDSSEQSMVPNNLSDAFD